MKHKFRGSELKKIVFEEVKRYTSLKKLNESLEEPASEPDAPELTMKYCVVILGQGMDTPTAKVETVDIEDAVFIAQHFTEKGFSLDPEQTSEEILQSMGNIPTQDISDVTTDVPAPIEDEEEQQAAEVAEALAGKGRTQKRPKKDEFLKQTYELIKPQMPNLTFDDFLKIEIPGGMSGKVNVLFYYYQTIDMPDQVAQKLLNGMKKQENV